MPAVYFVSATLANIKRIADDLDKQLYESFHLNFVEPLSRSLLEELAASVARDGTGDLVEQVCTCFSCIVVLFTGCCQVVDQYLSFIAPSPSLFSLLPPPATAPPPGQAESIPQSTYALLNSPSSSEQQIESEIERIALGLFSAIVTAGTQYCGL